MTSVSVIVPTYKRITQTIKSIKLLLNSQGVGEIFQMEVIITDCTPDDEIEKAVSREFSTKIIYTRPAYQGIGNNKNNGAKIAQYPIIIFSDSDIEVEEDTILKTIASLKLNPTAAGVTGRVVWKGGDKNGKVDRPSPDDRMEKIGTTTYLEAIFSRYFATYKKIFEDVGRYDETVFNMHGEGSDLSTRYWRAGYPLTFDSGIQVYHNHDAPFSIALRVNSPEEKIARDFLLLAYKYDMFDLKYKNFITIIANNFKKFGNEGYFRVINGIGKNLNVIKDSLVKIDLEKAKRNTLYDFKFLEVFSDREMFKSCIQNASQRMKIICELQY